MITHVERHFVGRCDGNFYLTPPGHAGSQHIFDSTDVFVIQCIGKKHWRIYDEYTTSRIAAGRVRLGAERSNPHHRRATSSWIAATSYTAARRMHEAFARRESMHLTISLASLLSPIPKESGCIGRRYGHRAAATRALVRHGYRREAEQLAEQVKERLSPAGYRFRSRRFAAQQHPARLQSPDALTGSESASECGRSTKKNAGRSPPSMRREKN